MRRRVWIITFLLCALMDFGRTHLAASAQKVPATKMYKGMCDASAAVALDGNTFIAASDEDNDLRVYDVNNPAELQRAKLSETFKGLISDGTDLEIDLEGATWLGDKIFWIGSHSASKSGRSRPSRHRLFAIKVLRSAERKFRIIPVGQIYTDLIAALEKDPRYKGFNFKGARNIKPKDIGGVSVEAIASTPEGHLLIGFRNPLVGGRVSSEKILTDGESLVVEMMNPLDVIEGEAAKFAEPIVLGLGGLGIRGMEYDKSRGLYVILAGPYFNKDVGNLQDPELLKSRVYLWSGKRTETPGYQQNFDLNGFNAETVFAYPEAGKGLIEILSDDGKLNCNGGFRGTQLTLK